MTKIGEGPVEKQTVHYEVNINGGWYRCRKQVRTGNGNELHYELMDGTAGLTRDWKEVTTVTRR